MRYRSRALAVAVIKHPAGCGGVRAHVGRALGLSVLFPTLLSIYAPN